MKEEEFFKRRLEDLASQSYQGNRYTFTNFLNASEQTIYYMMQQDLAFAKGQLFGGYEGSERNVLRFGSEENTGYEMPFPISCVVAEPLIEKFADKLTHRDFLGALMNLGIERSMLGDILIKNKTGYIFCVENMAEYIVEHLDKVKHTNVKCSIAEEMPEAVKPTFESARLTISSNRCDSIVAKLYHLSRTQSLDLFRTQKIAVNGRLFENNSATLKAGDIVSVRGYGKFIYDGDESQTKKGRLSVSVRMYI